MTTRKCWGALVALALALGIALVAVAGAQAQEAGTPPGETPPAEAPAYDGALAGPEDDAVELTVTEDGATETDGMGRTVDAKATTNLRSCGNYSVELTSWEKDLMERINRKRAELGRQRMCVERRLHASADHWAEYLARNNAFYHGGLRYVCPNFNYCGYDQLYENVGYQDKAYGPGNTFQGYLDSSGHRSAMLGANRDRMGTDWHGNADWNFNVLHLADHPGE